MKVSEIHPRLYHYTTLQGVLGIIQSQCLWATHYKFLNDSSEIIRFHQELIEILCAAVRADYEKASKKSPHAKEIILANGGLDTIVRHDVKVFVDSCHESLDDEIYSVSKVSQLLVKIPLHDLHSQ